MSMCRNDPAATAAPALSKIDTRTMSLDEHRALFKTPPVSYLWNAKHAAVAEALAVSAPSATVATVATPTAPAPTEAPRASQRTTKPKPKRSGPQRATALQSSAATLMRGREFTSNDLATALAKGRRQATAVLNSWVRKGLVERAGARTEQSGQHSTVWRFAMTAPAGAEGVAE